MTKFVEKQLVVVKNVWVWYNDFIKLNSIGEFILRKFIVCFVVVFGIFALAACGGTTDDDGAPQDPTPPAYAPPLEEQQTGDESTTVDETQWPPLELSITLTPENRVVIETNRPLREFEMVRLEDDFDDDYGLSFIPISLYREVVEEFLPGETFVIDDFIGGGTLPTDAVTFIDQYGERRYFAFQHDHSLGLDPNPFMPDFLDNVVDGQVRIYATTGGGNRTDLGYFSVDVSDPYVDCEFDVDLWLVENSYRWAAHAMVIWELHNIS